MFQQNQGLAGLLAGRGQPMPGAPPYSPPGGAGQPMQAGSALIQPQGSGQNFLSKLFNPGAADSYSPRKEQMLASLLSSQAPNDGWGNVIGNLAKTFVGLRGLKSQEKAGEAQYEQQQSGLAEALSGIGQSLNLPQGTDLGALSQSPLGGQLLGELIEQGRPQAPEEAPAQMPDASTIAANLGIDPAVMAQIQALPSHQERIAALQHVVEQAQGPEPAQGFSAGGIPFDAEGNPRVDPAALRDYRQQAGMTSGQGKDRITPTNVTMPDGSVRLVTTPDQMDEAQQAGATLPQGASRQRPMTEKQTQAAFHLSRMRPQAELLFKPGEDGSTMFDVLSNGAQIAAERVPGGAGRFMQSGDFQVARGAAQEIIAAGLRFESGGAITHEESLEKADQMLPAINDKPDRVEHKASVVKNYISALTSVLPDWKRNEFSDMNEMMSTVRSPGQIPPHQAMPEPIQRAMDATTSFLGMDSGTPAPISRAIQQMSDDEVLKGLYGG